MKKYCLFDLDGTLVDSMSTWAGTMLKILEEENMTYPDDTVRVITPLGYKGTAKHFIKLGVKKDEDTLIDRMYELAADAYADYVVLKAGVKDYIKKLTSEGISCNVLTASPHRVADICLKRNGVYDLFDNVWTIEDFDMTKDNPQIYCDAAKKLGCTTDDICFFDDNIIALKAGKDSGCTVYGVYDSFSDDATDLIKQLVDKYIVTFEELL